MKSSNRVFIKIAAATVALAFGVTHPLGGDDSTLPTPEPGRRSRS